MCANYSFGLTTRIFWEAGHNKSAADGEEQDFEEDDFVLDKLTGKKMNPSPRCKGYKKNNNNDGDLSVTFLRLTSGGKFVFPNIYEEISIASHDVKKLSTPFVPRGHHGFKEDLSKFKNLNWRSP